MEEKANHAELDARPEQSKAKHLKGINSNQGSGFLGFFKERMYTALRRHAEKTVGRVAVTSTSLNAWGGLDHRWENLQTLSAGL